MVVSDQISRESIKKAKLAQQQLRHFFSNVVPTRKRLSPNGLGCFLPFIERFEAAFYCAVCAPKHAQRTFYATPPLAPQRTINSVVFEID